MTKDSPLLPMDFHGVNALAEPHKADGTPPTDHPRKTRRLSRKTVMISSGVFLVVAFAIGVMTTYVFVENAAEETSPDMPQTPWETMLTELPVAKIRHERTVAAQGDQEIPYVSVVEIDASIIVHETGGELLLLESLLRSHQHRIEEAIDHTIRSTAPDDLAEPDTETLRTRIRDRINEVLGTPVAKEVIFSHYRAFRTPNKTKTGEQTNLRSVPASAP